MQIECKSSFGSCCQIQFMATIKIILDTRRQREDGTYPLKLRVFQNRSNSTFTLNLFITEEQWNSQKQLVKANHSNHQTLNKHLKFHYLKAQQAILELEYKQENFTAKEVINVLKGKPDKTTKKKDTTIFEYGYKLVNRQKQAGKIGNARAYENTLKRLESYLKHRNLPFVDITYDWLEEFEADFLSSGIKVNTISFYLRTIRAIYNRAIKAKLVDRTAYPFNDFTIKRESTAKRAISKEKIKLIENVELPKDTPIWHNRNFFILSFNLIGISFIDLAFLEWDNIQNGRVQYLRKKTKKLYNIKLTKKAAEILACYEDHHQGKYVLPIIDNNIVGDLEKEQFYSRQGYKLCNKYLKRICELCGIEETVTTYVARHSWATSAKRLGFSKDLIAEALGHEYGNRITGIYLDDYDLEVIDEMNDRVCQ